MNPYESGFSGGPNLGCDCGQTNVQCYRDRSSGLCSTEDSGVKRVKRALETFLLDIRSFYGMAPPMTTRKSKIALLPFNIRELLNHQRSSSTARSSSCSI